MILAAASVFVKDYHGQTTVHNAGLAMLILAGLAIFILPRRWALIPMLVMACFVSPAQRIVVLGLDFNFIRCMVLFGWIRLLTRGEARGHKWIALDTAVVAWGVLSTIFYTILMGDSSALVYRLGTTYDAVGLYFLFRFLIRDWNDISSTAIAFSLISVPVLAFFIVERLTRYNLFSVFGGVPTYTLIREGRMRCQGAFAHSILAGCFWAALIPINAALLWQGPMRKFLGIVGVFNCLGLIFLCASSTPLAATILGGMAWLLFPIRRSMRAVRWAIVLTAFALHMSMKQPVWHLLARIDLVGGSTGWHRFRVVDQTINRWTEWFVSGTRSTAHWGFVDITNEYVLHALRGGIVTLGAFVAIIVIAFIAVGRMIRTEHANKARLMMAWALGVGLFIHMVSFVSVSYFGQIHMLWYLHLALIGSALCASEARLDLLRRRRRAMLLNRTPRKRSQQQKPMPVVAALHSGDVHESPNTNDNGAAEGGHSDR